MRLLAALAALAVSLTMSSAVLADIAPNDSKVVEYTYEIGNLAAYPQYVFVAWPRTCGSDGDPVGTIDLELNPHAVPHQHDPDYEVMRPGAKHEALKYCLETMRIYALEASAFPGDARVAAEDNWQLGQKKGDPWVGIKAIDAMTWKERMPFFQKDPRPRRSDFQIPGLIFLRRRSPVKKVHDVIEVKSVDAKTFTLAAVRSTYTNEDGTTDQVSWRSSRRPSSPRSRTAFLVPSFSFGDEDAGPLPATDGTDDGSGAPASLAVPPPRPSRASEPQAPEGPLAPDPWGTRATLAAVGLSLVLGAVLAARNKS